MFTQWTLRDILRVGGEFMTINDRLKEVRLVLDLSQERFGQPLGLTKTSVSASENGLRVVSDRTVLLLRASYRVSPDWMYTGEGKMFEDHGDDFDEVARQLNLNDFQRRLVQIIYEMPIEHQRIIRDYAVKLAADDDAARATSEETEHERIERVANDYMDIVDAQERENQNTDKKA